MEAPGSLGFSRNDRGGCTLESLESALIATTTPTRPTPTTPRWVDDWVGPPTSTRPIDHHDGVLHYEGRADHGQRFTHARVRVRNANALSDLELQHATAEAYRLIHRALEAGQARHPVRFWNFIPGIVDAAAADGLDRYMVFNAGRFAAFSDWYHAADRDSLAPHIATATGVGHFSTDLFVHCLADRLPGHPIENPRQCAAYRYSTTYGPLPPCFARATVVADNDQTEARRVLVGGTSSIVGEDSVHVGDLAGQTRETLDNIDALLREAGADGLAALHDVRVYHVHEQHGPAILEQVNQRLPHLVERIEMVHAPLCRADLGVEIEGMADAT